MCDVLYVDTKWRGLDCMWILFGCPKHNMKVRFGCDVSECDTTWNSFERRIWEMLITLFPS